MKDLKISICIFFFLIFINSRSFSQLSGTYTIGPGGDYPTINSSVIALTVSGVNGPVTFNILTGVYNEIVNIDSIPGSGPFSRITFQSQSGNREDVLVYDSADNEDAVIDLNRTDHITFRNISFLNATSMSVQYVFRLNQNCEGINISNNKIMSEGIFEGYGIYGNNSRTRDLVISENNFDAVIAINLNGSATSAGTRITNNLIRRLGGALLSNHDSLFIENNEIILDYRLGFPSGGPAIFLTSCDKYIKISKNKINVKGNGRYYPSSGILIRNCLVQNSLIANNFVYYTGGVGIEASGSANIQILFNTIHSLFNYYTSLAANLRIENCNGCVVKNNILGGVNTVYENNFNSSLISDYNSFYPKGEEVLPRMFYFNNTGIDSLVQYIAASNNDQHSNVKTAFFVSNTDLHLTGSSIGDTGLTGYPIAEVSEDIDGHSRNPIYPYRGADEADVSLPVELNSFSYEVTGNDVSLLWSTSSENNNWGFNIERTFRSGGSDSWQTIGFVKGKGTTGLYSEYNFKNIILEAGCYKFRLKQIDYNGSFKYFYLNSEVEINLPLKYELSQNFPNPFNPVTVINYRIPVNGLVSLKIYDISGREISALVNEKQSAGYYSVIFNGESLPSGTYFYRLQSEKYIETKSMVLIK